MIPAVAIGGDGLEWSYQWGLQYDYGQVLEATDFQNDYSNGALNAARKELRYYSGASLLWGEGIINGYVFKDEAKTTKSVSTTSQSDGMRVEGVLISLCQRQGDFVLASCTTGVDGLYQFKGVPKGNFYLKAEIEGYIQKSTYEIEVSHDKTIFEDRNFMVSDGAISTGLGEARAKEIKVYPNPTTDRVFVTGITEGQSQTIRVVDTNGRTVRSYTVSNGQLQIDLSREANGIYYLHVKGRENKVVKIVKY